MHLVCSGGTALSFGGAFVPLSAYALMAGWQEGHSVRVNKTYSTNTWRFTSGIVEGGAD